MKTIEERANDAASHSFIEDGEIRIYVNESEKEYYIKGATEQKEIDKEKADVACGNSYRNGYYDAIEKACEWLKARAKAYGEADGFDAVYVYDTDMLVRHFKKAMDEYVEKEEKK